MCVSVVVFLVGVGGVGGGGLTTKMGKKDIRVIFNKLRGHFHPFLSCA